MALQVYQQIFNNVIGYDYKALAVQNDYIKIYEFCSISGTSCVFKNCIHIGLDHFKGKAYFVDGTTASGMGIVDYLFDHTDLKFLLIDEIDKLSKKDQKVLLNVMETGMLSDVKAKRSKSARQNHMHLSIYATSNDTSNILVPLLSRFIKLNLPEYNLVIFTEICQKLLSRKYDKDHETIQLIVRYVWEHTRDVAKIADTSDEVNSIASTLSRYSNGETAISKRNL